MSVIIIGLSVAALGASIGGWLAMRRVRAQQIRQYPPYAQRAGMHKTGLHWRRFNSNRLATQQLPLRMRWDSVSDEMRVRIFSQYDALRLYRRALRIETLYAIPQPLAFLRKSKEQNMKPLGIHKVFAKMSPAEKTNPVQESPDPVVEELAPGPLIGIFLMAPTGQPFAGDRLMQSLVGAGLRYGERQIFHRPDPKGRGELWFSVATVNKPGTFDLSNMRSLRCPGLVFFMTVGHCREPMLAFETLLQTVQRLAEELQGDIHSDIHSVLTKDKIFSLRREIQEFQKMQKNQKNQKLQKNAKNNKSQSNANFPNSSSQHEGGAMGGPHS